MSSIKLLQLAPDGSLQEVSVSLSGGGTGLNTGSAIIDFGSTLCTDASIDITGQTGILSTSYINVQLIGIDSVDHDSDEHIIEDIKVIAGNIIPGTGFTIYAHCNIGLTYGKFNLVWNWS